MISRLRKSLSSRYLRIGVGAAIGGLSLYLALRNVSLLDVQMALSHARLDYVTWALLSVAATTAAKAVRWKVLMGPQGKDINLKHSTMVILAGQALNTVYPARIGDITRAYIIGGMGPGKIFILGTILLEKLLDTISYSILFFLLLLLIPLPRWIGGSAYTIAGISLVGLAVFFLVAYRIDWFARIYKPLIQRLPEGIREKAQRWLSSGLTSLEILQSRPDLLKMSFWSMVVWITAVLTNYLSLLALQIHLPITASMLVLVVLQVSVSLPSIPGRIGIFEYLCVLSLAVFGISQALAFSYGILLHIIALVPSTIIGLIFLGLLSLGEKRSTNVGS